MINKNNKNSKKASINIREEFGQDYTTREAGERLRLLILDAFGRDAVVEIDFSGVKVASASFFDEAFAKLALEGWNREDFYRRLSYIHLHHMDEKLLEQVCKVRFG